MGPERHEHVHGYGCDPTSTRSSVLLVEGNSSYSCNITWKCSKASSNYRTKAYNYNWRTFTCERNIWRVVDKNSKEDTRKSEKKSYRKNDWKCKDKCKHNFKNIWCRWCNNVNQGNRIVEIMLHFYMVTSPIFYLYDYYVMFGWLTCYIMLECETKYEYLLLFFGSYYASIIWWHVFIYKLLTA